MPNKDNVLYQSKILFSNLMKSERPVHNPVDFFRSIKDYDGSIMPTNEQKDVDEFLNIYMDKIEQATKGTDTEHLYSSIFGGAFAQELICKDCPHRSSRDEPFMTLPIEVKNKNSIQEGLDSFIQGEMLEGENAYHCDRCDKKVDTLKRCCIKKLPNILIIVLKRFEFDFETMRRVKLNTYCEYPNQINMKAYCQETLAKNELEKKMKEETLGYAQLNDHQKSIYDKQLPDNYYTYNLKGTLIHYGTADAGHYYSYIQERKPEAQWYEFNDTLI